MEKKKKLFKKVVLKEFFRFLSIKKMNKNFGGLGIFLRTAVVQNCHFFKFSSLDDFSTF